MITQKQLSLADIFEDRKEIYDSDKPQFLTLLENHIDLDEIVPISFYNHYYKDFKKCYPLIQPKIFLGDAAFDTIEIYKSLFEDFKFQKAFIPLRVKLLDNNIDYTFNENGIPCCPHDSSLPMRREGSKSHLRSSLPIMKFVCPKMKWEYNREDKSKRRVCHCDNPCTTSTCGRMIYVYPEKNLRAYPGVEHGSEEWDETYKITVNVEKSINHFKDSFCVANRKTTNEKTIHADLLLAGISQLLTIVVADKINRRQHIRSLKTINCIGLTN